MVCVKDEPGRRRHRHDSHNLTVSSSCIVYHFIELTVFSYPIGIRGGVLLALLLDLYTYTVLGIAWYSVIRDKLRTVLYTIYYMYCIRYGLSLGEGVLFRLARARKPTSTYF